MKLFFIICLSLFLSICCFSQRKGGSEEMSCDYLLDATKPSSFITFERYDRRTYVREGESDEGIFLRLHNNTKWNIYLVTNGVDDQNKDHLVSYEVRSIPGLEWKQLEIPLGTRINHMARIQKVKSGGSLLFSVMKEHLSSGLAIFVYFSYEWEFHGDTAGDFSISHQAPFWSTNLPRETRK
jgi:hypothetical protein